MKKGTTSALLGFLAGVAAGTVTGILIAPDKGSEVRKDLSKRVKSASNEMTGVLNEKIEGLREQVDRMIKEMRSEAKRSAEERIEEK